MRKTLFTVFAALSLVVCMGALALWAQSYSVMQGIERIHKSRDVAVLCFAGIIAYESRFDSGPDIPIRYVSKPSQPGANPPQWIYGTNGNVFVIAVPCWFVALLAAVLPTIWVVTFRRTHPPGTCQKCGYDLRASKERCPECGTPIAPLTPSPSGRGSG